MSTLLEVAIIFGAWLMYGLVMHRVTAWVHNAPSGGQ